jgi:hypothetical protein
VVLVRPARVPADTDRIFGFHRITIGEEGGQLPAAVDRTPAVPGRH